MKHCSHVIIACCCTILILSGSCKSAQVPKARASAKPNILFIAIDDLRPELKAYGKQYMITPHIDRLAAGGRVFLNHYVNVPTCGPSRFALLTGRLPQNTAALSNNVFESTTALSSQGSEPESMAELFKRNGYETIGIGKISHAPDGRIYGYTQSVSDKMELPQSWNKFLFNPGKWGTGWNAFFGYASGSNRQSLKGQVKPYEAADVADEGYPDGLTAQLAVSELNRLKGSVQPFFLAVGFFKPHLPFNAPKKYWDLYDEKTIPLSSAGIPAGINNASLHNSNEFNQYKNTDEKASLKAPLSNSYARKLKHAYFAAVTYTDAQVGKVLKALKEAGLEDNTIVVLWGDHGWHLGDQRVWGKHTLSEYSLKSPLIIRYPGIPQPGIATTNIAQSVDIYPTLLELANIERQTNLSGRSLLKELRNPAAHLNNVAYGYFNKGITMRTNRYRITKYFRQEQPVIELYDYISDTGETKNIAADRPALVNELLPKLEQGNTGLYTTNP